jgi:hypothetical protein
MQQWILSDTFTMLRVLQVFAQIDTAAGIEAFDSILEEADGVVVNRGNLGLHIEAEKVGRPLLLMPLPAHRARTLCTSRAWASSVFCHLH